jgi:hypothetical protein
MSSTPPVTPYTPELDGRDPLAVMPESIDAIARLVGGWTADQFERSYAPGKWTVRQLLIHLAQSELALGTRARMALTRPNFAAQSFDQDRWLARELSTSGADAVQLFVALARANYRLYASLTTADRQTPFTHDEYGPMTVDWVIYQQAGHHVHHLKQLRAVQG